MNKIIFLLIFLFSSSASSAVVDLKSTGRQPTVITPQGKLVNLYSQSRALVISVAEYKGSDPWVELPNTTKEMDDVTDALRDNGFDVRRVKDPTGDELAGVIKSFLSGAGRAEDSRILFFYSGHGYYDKATKEAYLVPSDAMKPSSKDTNFFEKSYAIEDIKTAALRMPAKHGMFIFDNCFSGMVFKSDSSSFPPVSRGDTVSDRWRYLQQNAHAPVLQFISAGGPDQVLPAVSIFVPVFLQALEAKGPDGYVTGKEIGLTVAQRVPGISRTQTPYSDVVGKVWGDMIFQNRTGDTLVRTADASGANPDVRLEALGSSNKSESSGLSLASLNRMENIGSDAADKEKLRRLSWIDAGGFKLEGVGVNSSSIVKLEGLKRDAGGCVARRQSISENGRFLLSVVDRENLGVFRTSDGKMLKKFKHNTSPGSDCTIMLYDAFFDGGNKVVVSVLGGNYERYIYDAENEMDVPIRLPRNERIVEIWPNPKEDEILIYSVTPMEQSRKPKRNYGGDGDIHFRVMNGAGKIVKEKTLFYSDKTSSAYQAAHNSFDIYGRLGQSRYADGVLLRRDNFVLVDAIFESEIFLISSWQDLGCKKEVGAIVAARNGRVISSLDDSGAYAKDFSVCYVSVDSSGVSARNYYIKFPEKLSGARHYLLSAIGTNFLVLKSEIFNSDQQSSKSVIWGYDIATQRVTSGSVVEVYGELSVLGGNGTTWYTKPDNSSVDLYVVRFSRSLMNW